LLKKASADLSKYFILFLVFSLFNRVETQNLNYSLDWESGNFIVDAKNLMRNLTLQNGHHLLSGEGFEGNILLSSATSISLTESLPSMPLFSTLYHVSENLWMGGLFSGYMAGDNVIILSGYVMELMPGDISQGKVPLCLELSRRSLDGANDFSLKTIGISLTKRTNFNSILLRYGISSSFFDVIFRSKPYDFQESLPNRLKGQVNSIIGTAELSYGKFISGLKLNLTNKGVSFMISISALLKS